MKNKKINHEEKFYADLTRAIKRANHTELMSSYLNGFIDGSIGKERLTKKEACRARAVIRTAVKEVYSKTPII